MDNFKDSSLESENEGDCMEWEENKGRSRKFDAEGTSSVDPHVTPGSDFSQPSTSGYSGQKRKSNFFSPLPEKIPRDSRIGKQQEDLPSVNETNLYNNCNVASGFSVDFIPQMMPVEPSGISRQSTSASVSSVILDEDIDCSEGNISIDCMIKYVNTLQFSKRGPFLDTVRNRIISILEAEGSPHDTEGIPAETDGTALGIESHNSLQRIEEQFSRQYDLPKRFRKALRRHLNSHGLIELPSEVLYERILQIARRCLLCEILVSYF